jgi:hypothetical protein
MLTEVVVNSITIRPRQQRPLHGINTVNFHTK